jgi:hypothetical protein
MMGYEQFFRISSSREEGWLETKLGRTEHWMRKWVVFDDGVLNLFPNQDINDCLDDDAGIIEIPMDQVVSLRTDVS